MSCFVVQPWISHAMSSVLGPIVNCVPAGGGEGGGGRGWFSKCSVSKLDPPKKFEVKIIPSFPILV